MNNLSISVLSKKTEDFICSLLNTRMVLPTEDGFLRDYRGLAEKLNIPISQVNQEPSPSRKILTIWSSTNKESFKIEVLLNFLESLDRFDIIDDSAALIKEDIELFNKISSNEASCLLDYDNYDATILYAEEDSDFVREIVHKMENTFQMKMFVKERDLKGGEFELQTMLTKIAQHCDKLIVVLSPDFLSSETNKYFLAYAQTIAIEQKRRKIIPCVYKRCQVPLQLIGLHTIYYDANNRWIDFWSKLAQSVKTNGVSNPQAMKSLDFNANKDKVVASETTSCYATKTKQSTNLFVPQVNNCEDQKKGGVQSDEATKEALKNDVPSIASKADKSFSAKCKSTTRKYYKLGKHYVKTLHTPRNDNLDELKKEKCKEKKNHKSKIAVAL